MSGNKSNPIIVISSDEEDEVVLIKEVKSKSDQKDVVESPSRFRIDYGKLKHLKAVLKVEFENNLVAHIKREDFAKDENRDAEGDDTFTTKNEPMETHSMTSVMPTIRIGEQPFFTPSLDVNAKRNELVWPPRHVILDSEEFISKLYRNPQEFPTTYKYLIEGLQDEEFFSTVVETIESLMSNDLAPPTEMIWFLVNNILSNSSDSSLVCSTYSLLNEILERYPTKCISMNIKWEDIKKHFPTVEARKDQESSSRKTNHSMLVLSFLLSVLSAELKATALKTKRRSRLSQVFSADSNLHHVKDVMPCLKDCLENHDASTLLTCSIRKKQDAPGTASICEVKLCQNLLKLFMIVSVDKENAALRLANELMYLYIDLPNLQQRVLLVQSVTSHLVRVHLIKILLMNYCLLLPEALQDVNLPLSVRKIFLQDFYRKPPHRQTDGYSHSVEDIEEYVTLLAYMMQSYVFLHSPVLRTVHNDYPLCFHEFMKEFTEEDLWHLKKSHLSALRLRCISFLNKGQKLSSRTDFLLQLMEFTIDV